MMQEIFMWGELPKKYKKRLNIIAFVYLPILMILALALSTWIAKLLRFNVDVKGVAIVFCSFIPLYFICLRTAYKKIRKMSVIEDKD